MGANWFPNLSPSRVHALVCLKRFEAEYVSKTAPRPGFTQPLAFGSAVHETLKGVFDPRNDTPPASRDIRALAEQAILRQRYPDPALRTTDTDRCVATVCAYLAQDTDGGATLAVEVFESVPITSRTVHPLVLGAKFDRLIVREAEPDHLVIRDYKTGSSGHIDLDGACVMLAVALKRFKEYRSMAVEFDYLNGHGLVKREVITRDEAKAVWSDLRSRALRVYSATEFPAEPGEHCAWCPLRAECQPGSAVEPVDLQDLDNLFS